MITILHRRGSMKKKPTRLCKAMRCETGLRFYRILSQNSGQLPYGYSAVLLFTQERRGRGSRRSPVVVGTKLIQHFLRYDDPGNGGLFINHRVKHRWNDVSRERE